MDKVIEGVFTPHMVPLDDRGNIAEEELRRYLDWLIDRGVHGLYPNGSTSEFLRFTADERRRIVKIACEVAGGRVPVLAGASEANIKETLRACEAYADYGARAVAIVSPFYYRLSPDSVYAYFSEIATQSPIDITLYNIPMFASPIDVPTLARLASYDRIVGIKDSTGDLSAMQRMIAAVRPQRPDFAFLTGWEPVLASMMAIGANGGTHATSGVVPELTRAIYDAAAAGQMEIALALQQQLLPLFDSMLHGLDFPEGFRVGVELRGFRMGDSRQPLTSGQRDLRADLAKRVEGLIRQVRTGLEKATL